MVFCSVLLVIACMFSVEREYSKYSMIWRNAVQVHLSLALHQVIVTVLLYVDNFHINVSLNNGRFNFITIGAYFCEVIVATKENYYHCQQKYLKNFIIIDYVVSMKHAKEKGWVLSDRISVITSTTGPVHENALL